MPKRFKDILLKLTAKAKCSGSMFVSKQAHFANWMGKLLGIKAMLAMICDFSFSRPENLKLTRYGEMLGSQVEQARERVCVHVIVLRTNVGILVMVK